MASMNSVTANIPVHAFLANTHAFLLAVYLGVELLSYNSISICAALVDNIKQFSKAIVFIYTIGSNHMRIPSMPQLHQQLGFILTKEVFLSLRKIFCESWWYLIGDLWPPAYHLCRKFYTSLNPPSSPLHLLFFIRNIHYKCDVLILLMSMCM